MEEAFLLPVTLNGKELVFPASLFKNAYSFRWEVEIEGTKVNYEPDEEGKWRAVIPYEQIPVTATIDPALLKAIAEVIEEIMS